MINANDKNNNQVSFSPKHQAIVREVSAKRHLGMLLRSTNIELENEKSQNDV